MSKSVFGGLFLAAFFAGDAATAAPASPATPSRAHNARGSFFTSNQDRADVPARIERMFKELDSNRDGFVTKEEIAALQAQFDERAAKSATKRAARMFDRMDSDHDGKITEPELHASRASRLAAGGKPAKASHRGGSSLLTRADTNKDGFVTRAEFDAAITGGKIKLRHAGMRGSQIVRLFDASDKNNDGRISLDEAQQEALRQFDAADLDHDGVLTPAERRQAAKTNRTKRPPA